jgi:putative heme transporter
VSPERLSDRPFVRIGVYAWSVIGLALAITLFGIIFVQLRVLTIPLILALFPTAILIPVVNWLDRLGWRRGVATGVSLVFTFAVGAAIIAFAVNAIQQQLPELVESVQAGWAQLSTALEEGMFGLPPLELDQIVDEVVEWAREELAENVLAALVATVEGVAALGFGLVALFFYLRDGGRIAAWLRDLFPRAQRAHIAEIGTRTWTSLGGYIRGQSLVALVDAVFIGIGLVILGVPLAFVLSVFVFFGGYVPIVGAFVTGALAVLVALASEGMVIALLTLAVVVAVQQLESNLLAPMVLGRSTALHPLAVLVALTIGAIVYGVIGAIIAVPFAAAIARAGSYLREVTSAHDVSDGQRPDAEGEDEASDGDEAPDEDEVRAPSEPAEAGAGAGVGSDQPSRSSKDP